jgi:thiol:disulfide interchange protein
MGVGLMRPRYGVLALAAVTLTWGALLPSVARPAAEKAVDLNKAVTYTLEPDVFDPMNEATKSSRVRRGTVVRLVIKGTVAPGAYTYPLTIPPGQPASINVSSLTTRVDPGLVPLPPPTETPPEVGSNKDGPYAKYTKPFVWGVDILVKPDAPTGPRKIEFDIRSTACNESQCVPFVRKLTTTLDVSSEQAEQLPDSLADRVKAAPTPEPIGSAAAPGSNSGQTGISPYIPADLKASLERVRAQLRGSVTAAGQEESDLLAFILAGIFWGAVSLITPCVFPMIPITVSYFLKQAEKEHHRPLAMASVYCPPSSSCSRSPRSPC